MSKDKDNNTPKNTNNQVKSMIGAVNQGAKYIMEQKQKQKSVSSEFPDMQDLPLGKTTPKVDTKNKEPQNNNVVEMQKIYLEESTEEPVQQLDPHTTLRNEIKKLRKEQQEERGQLILGYIGNQRKENPNKPINLSGIDCSNVSFKDVDLSYVNFDDANLTGAKLTGAKLTGAKLTGAKGITASQLKGVKGVEQLRSEIKIERVKEEESVEPSYDIGEMREVSLDSDDEELSIEQPTEKEKKENTPILKAKAANIEGIPQETLNEARQLKLADLQNEVALQKNQLQMLGQDISPKQYKALQPLYRQLGKNIEVMEEAIKEFGKSNDKEKTWQGGKSFDEALKQNQQALNDLNDIAKGTPGRITDKQIKPIMETAKISGKWAEQAKKQSDDNPAPEKKPSIFQRIKQAFTRKPDDQWTLKPGTVETREKLGKEYLELTKPKDKAGKVLGVTEDLDKQRVNNERIDKRVDEEHKRVDKERVDTIHKASKDEQGIEAMETFLGAKDATEKLRKHFDKFLEGKQVTKETLTEALNDFYQNNPKFAGTEAMTGRYKEAQLSYINKFLLNTVESVMQVLPSVGLQEIEHMNFIVVQPSTLTRQSVNAGNMIAKHLYPNDYSESNDGKKKTYHQATERHQLHEDIGKIVNVLEKISPVLFSPTLYRLEKGGVEGTKIEDIIKKHHKGDNNFDIKALVGELLEVAEQKHNDIKQYAKSPSGQLSYANQKEEQQQSFDQFLGKVQGYDKHVGELKNKLSELDGVKNFEEAAQKLAPVEESKVEESKEKQPEKRQQAFKNLRNVIDTMPEGTEQEREKKQEAITEVRSTLEQAKKNMGGASLGGDQKPGRSEKQEKEMSKN